MNAFGLVSAILETTEETDRDPERLPSAIVDSSDTLNTLDSQICIALSICSSSTACGLTIYASTKT
jgi:hypothetical protein